MQYFILHVIFKDRDAALSYWEDGEFSKGVQDSFTISTKAIFSQFKHSSTNLSPESPTVIEAETTADEKDKDVKTTQEGKEAENEILCPSIKDIFQSKLASFYEDAIMASKKSRHDVCQ